MGEWWLGSIIAVLAAAAATCIHFVAGRRADGTGAVSRRTRRWTAKSTALLAFNGMAAMAAYLLTHFLATRVVVSPTDQTIAVAALTGLAAPLALPRISTFFGDVPLLKRLAEWHDSLVVDEATASGARWVSGIERLARHFPDDIDRHVLEKRVRDRLNESRDSMPQQDWVKANKYLRQVRQDPDDRTAHTSALLALTKGCGFGEARAMVRQMRAEAGLSPLPRRL